MSRAQEKEVYLLNGRRFLNRLIFLIIILSLMIPSVLSATSEFTNQQTLKFTGTTSSPSTLYQDAMGTNVDVGIEVCGVVAPYVGGFYAMHNSFAGTWEYVLVTYSTGGANALAQTSVSGSCYTASPGTVTVSPSSFETPNPDTYRAALPANLWAGYANSANPGDTFGDNFVYSNGSAELRGSYTLTRSYISQVTGVVSITPTLISFISDSGTFSKSAADASFGISSTRPAVLGICNDNYGYNCNGATTATSAATSSLSSGITSPPDTTTTTMYAVINGKGYEMCIGANLDPSIDSVNPNPVYYSQTLKINYTVENPRDTPTEIYGGNVDVNQNGGDNFDVEIRIYNSTGQEVHSETDVITETIVPDGTTATRTVSWPAYGHSGQYRIEVEADSGGEIAECYESDNTAIAYFDLLPITLPQIYIDGTETNNFTYPNIPYNLTFILENSDGDILSNASLVIKERNGLSLTAPTQRFNISKVGGGTMKSGPVVDTYVNLVSDASGKISLTFIPTYNSLFLAKYNYTDIESYIGNYSLEFTGTESGGQSFMFILDGEDVISDYPFNVNNLNYTGDYLGKTIPNEVISAQVMDFIYHTFTNFLDVILS